MTVILPILFIVATLVGYLVPRLRRRPAVSISAATYRLMPLGVAEMEEGLKRPLADIVAEAERKAIAIHSPLAGDARRVELFTPPVRHPFDPCYLPNCPEARSQHEHVEVLGAGQYIVPLQPKANLGRRGGIEVTAIGDRERTFLDPDEHLTRVIRDRRLKVWGQARDLAARAESAGRPFTKPEQSEWDYLVAMLDALDRKLEKIYRAP